MCGGRSSILHYGPLIETNYLYAPTPNGQKPECVAKQKQYPQVRVGLVWLDLSPSGKPIIETFNFRLFYSKNLVADMYMD